MQLVIQNKQAAEVYKYFIFITGITFLKINQSIKLCNL